jgi:hypothetical protein
MYKVASLIPDKIYLSLKYKKNFGYFLDWKHPKTFSEKINWLKLYDRNPLYTRMVDKYEVKEYVAGIIGKQYVIPTLGVWDRAEDIDFDLLPDQFVLKATHDSGRVVICTDKAKLDKVKAVEEMKKSLKRDFYAVTREWPYKNVKRRIIAEKFIAPRTKDTPKDLPDYKFFCFNGKVRCFKIDYGRFTEHHANYYSHDGNLLPFGEKMYPPVYDHKEIMPYNLSEMIEMAEKLSEGHSFLRVDLYSVCGKTYFGELTFFPNSGMATFTDNKWDLKLGEWINLPM